MQAVPASARNRSISVLTSTWTLGLLAAVVTWNVTFLPPFPGLDPSWYAGLYMAADRGLHFGTQVIFTYGPLGFLNQPWMWYSDLATLAFIYDGLIHILLCVSLVWALRRAVHPALAVVVVFFVLVIGVGLDATVALAAVWCLAALSPDPPPFAGRLVVFGGSLLGAIETLIYIRSGLVVLAICAVTLLSGPRWRRELPAFLALALAALAVLWFAARQGLSNIPGFISASFQIISGYSDAMGVQAVPTGYLIAAVVTSIALIAAVAYTSAPGRRRLAATVIAAVITFSLFKEASIRAEAGHTVIFFGTAAALVAAIAFGRRWVIALLAVAGLLVVTVNLNSLAGTKVSYNPVTYLSRTSDQVRLLFNPGRRDLETDFFFRVGLTQQYNLSKRAIGLLRGHTVQVDPWEVAAAWAYDLDWDPGPVLQDYNAYTARLDRLDASALSSPTGPQRILRQNPAVQDPAHPRTSIDQRFVAWDPPAQSLAMLCNYVALQTTTSWQVLGKVRDRCGSPRLVEFLKTQFGATVTVPPAAAGHVVYAEIYGAGVSGFERLRAFLFRAKFRYLIVNGADSYRLVPDTAADGLIMNAGRGADYPAPFALAPGARTIKLTGVSGPLRIDLYSMAVG